MSNSFNKKRTINNSSTNLTKKTKIDSTIGTKHKTTMNYLPSEIIKYILADMLKDKDKFNLFTANQRYNSYINDIYLNESFYTNLPFPNVHTFKIRKYKMSCPIILPNHIKELIVDDIDYSQLQNFNFPNSLESLHVKSCCGKLTREMFPANLQKLIIDGYLSRITIVDNIFPEKLHTLIIEQIYHPLLPRVLPPNLHTLKFRWNTNEQLVPRIFPDSLHTLCLGVWQNRVILPGVLPPNLHTLYFGYHFNQPLTKGILPESLRLLSFSEHFNQPIPKGVLPSKLEILEFDTYGKFNQPFEDDALPVSLQSLCIGVNYSHEIKVHENLKIRRIR
jgi:hypothetical protein